MKKVKFNDTYIYVDDDEVDVKETGVFITDEEELEKTKEIIIDKSDLEDTLTDIWSEKNEQ